MKVLPQLDVLECSDPTLLDRECTWITRTLLDDQALSIEVPLRATLYSPIKCEDCTSYGVRIHNNRGKRLVEFAITEVCLAELWGSKSSAI